MAKIALLSIDSYKINKNIKDLLNFKEIIFFIIIFYLIRRLNKHPISYILVAAVLGILFKF